MNEAHKIKPSAITIEHLSAEYILGFLESLEKERKNQPKTINNRLSAINSFLKFLSFEIPEYSGLLSRSIMIPFKKEEKRTMDFLTAEEYRALENACSMDSWQGHRNKLMLLLLYNLGVRVSELLAIKAYDIVFDVNGNPSYARIHGKGRKERDVPLWKSTASFLRKYMSEYAVSDNDDLFLNCRDEPFTRSGVRYSLDRLVKKAAESVSTIKRKKITPHTFRHTVALNLLQSGVDISTIAIWLGHESILTTHKYMEADLEMKRRTLEKLQEPGEFAFRFKPDDAVLAFLDSL
jgi:site-specific recombinase XerD